MFPSLLRTVQSGDLSAFGGLYDMTYDKIYRFVYHKTLDHIETQDIVSETYMKALKKISSFHWTHEGEFFSWLYRIAYTTTLDTVKHHKQDISIDTVTEARTDEKVEDNLIKTEKLDAVMDYIKTLSEREYHILTLRIWDDLSYAEISEITGESVTNTKKIVSRTLQKIASNVTIFFIFSLFLYDLSR